MRLRNIADSSTLGGHSIGSGKSIRTSHAACEPRAFECVGLSSDRTITMLGAATVAIAANCAVSLLINIYALSQTLIRCVFPKPCKVLQVKNRKSRPTKRAQSKHENTPARVGTRTSDVPSTSSGTRILTVSTVHREWYTGCRRQQSYVPALRLNGEWLRKAGFVAGRKVRVTVRVGTILLAALERIV